MVVDGESILQTLALNEQKAAELYRIFADKSEGEVKDLFLELLTDEQRHEKIYRALLDKHRKIHTTIPEEEAQYIELMLRNNLFKKDRLTSDEADELLKKMTPLEIAEKIEVDGILYGSELQRLFPDFAADEISMILGEERKHLRKVFTIKTRGYK